MSSQAASLHPVVRVLTLADLDRIMEIERAAYPFPWTRAIFEDCLNVGYDCRGLQLGSRLVGYAVQTTYAGECHLLNLCIDPEWQGRGFGGLMLDHCMRQARSNRCSSIFLEVRPSNAKGISLYRTRGFRVVGERPDYYRAEGGRESAIVMRLDLDDMSCEKKAPDVRRRDPF